jgi:hypothetical protein
MGPSFLPVKARSYFVRVSTHRYEPLLTGRLVVLIV